MEETKIVVAFLPGLSSAATAILLLADLNSWVGYLGLGVGFGFLGSVASYSSGDFVSLLVACFFVVMAW